MTYDGAEITVLKWEEYNPRSCIKRPTWFRMENTFAFGPGFFGLNCEYKWIWVCILTLASDKNGQPFMWNSDYIEKMTGISTKTQDKALEIYEKSLRVHINRAPGVQNWCTTDGRTNETNERTNAQKSEKFDFELVYKNYPRKIGKANGVKRCQKDIKTQEDFEALQAAIRRFSEHHKTHNTEARFLPYFSTFMSTWRDWLDPLAG